MSKTHPDSILWGLNFRRKKSAEVSKYDFLRTVTFFQNMNAKQLKIIGQYLHDRRYEENEFLFEVNHPGAALFIIMRGEVVVQTTSESQSATQLAIIKAGEFLGDLALLDDSPRSASARATKPTQAYALSRGDLNRLAQTHPEIACEVFRTLACIAGERLKATNRHLGAKLKAA